AFAPVPLYDRADPTHLRGYILRAQHILGPYRGGIDIHSDADLSRLTQACICRGDLNGDGRANGADIQPFIDCYLSLACPIAPCPALTCPCECADLNRDGRLDILDVRLFVAALLTVGIPACP